MPVAPDQLLILYTPGSRGDFLASAILGTLPEFKDHAKINNCTPYRKTHGFADNEQVFFKTPIGDLHKYHSIRIKLNSWQDYVHVTYLWKTKSLPETPNDCAIVNRLILWEVTQRRLDSRFDYVIGFSDLMDPNAVRSLYEKLNKEPMPQAILDAIVYNITLNNYNINQHNYTEYTDVPQNYILSKMRQFNIDK